MATIDKLICNLKDEVSKWFYQKGEVDGKLDEKAGTSVASSSSNGLMSSTDKTKLDGVEEGANNIIVDSAMSESSVNPVQNKIIYQELANKAPSSHIHSRLEPVKIPANADLNDYTTQGSFYCSMNADAQTLKNCPVTEAFHLECYKHNGVRQVLQTFFDTNVNTFERNYYAGGNRWSEWYKIINQSSVDSSLSTSSTNPVQNKVVNTALNGKSNTNHTHGEAYNATTLRDNTFCQVLGNVAIVSWWTGSVNISKTEDWVDLWTLPVTNKGKAVWTGNHHNSTNGLLYFRVGAGSNKVQALSTLATGNLPHIPGQLVFFID